MLPTVFVVLMLFWLFGGCFVAYDGSNGNFNARHFGGYTLIPWLCVAIVGYVSLFAGMNPVPLR